MTAGKSYNWDMPGATNTVLSALRIADPPAWRMKVRAALRAEGSVDNAARALGVSRSTLFRWLENDPELREGIELATRGGDRTDSAGKRGQK